MAKNQRLVVQAGSCMNNDGDGRICALQSSDCPAGTLFTSPQMLQQGGGGLAHGGTCATRQGTEAVAKIGSCLDVDDNGFCASDASSCLDPQFFVPVDDRCTIRMDGVQKNNGGAAAVVTKFGKCMADNTCYWSQQDCSNNPASWQKPHMGSNSSSDDDCSCGEVRVGACQDDHGFFYCAVSALACSTADQWIDAPSLLSDDDAPDCFPCRQEEEVTPIQGAPPPTISPTTDPIKYNDTPGNVARLGQTSSQASSKTPAIIGASVGGAVLLLVVMGIATVFGPFRNKKAHHQQQQQRESTTADKQVSDVPLETIENCYSSGHHHHYGVEDDIEDLSDDGL